MYLNLYRNTAWEYFRHRKFFSNKVDLTERHSGLRYVENGRINTSNSVAASDSFVYFVDAICSV